MVQTFFRVSQTLAQAADIAVRQVLDIKKDETVLIITNPIEDVLKISQALCNSCFKVRAIPCLIVQPKKLPFDYTEPAVISAMKSEPDVIISISAQKLGKDREALAEPYKGLDGKLYDHIFDQLLNGLKKTRAFWSPEVTIDIFVRTVSIDYAKLRKVCAKVENSFKNAKTVHVQTDLGTDMNVSVEGRKAQNDDGDYREPGKGGNLPAGEVFISPKLDESNGVIILDGSMTLDETRVLKMPVKITLEKGYVTQVEGGKEGDQLRDYLHNAGRLPYKMFQKGEITIDRAKEYSKNATNLGELGIGLNPRAKIVGNILEDEKVLGTVHFAIGYNFDQDALALIHSDCIVKKPTITIDQKTIMKKGRMLI